MEDYWKYRPARQPKVSQAKWQVIFDETNTDHWRGEKFNGRMIVEHGYPFPDFFRTKFVRQDGSKENKRFYGETAHMDVQRYVEDQGFMIRALDLI
jgi:hypothetical protein